MAEKSTQLLADKRNQGTIKGVVSKYQMLWRLLLTVVLLISIPTMLVNWFTLNNIYKENEQRNRQRLYENTQLFANYFNLQLNEMRELTYDLRRESTMMPEKLAAHPYNVLEAIDKLQYYGKIISVAQETYIYYGSVDIVISTNNSYLREFFANSRTLDSAELDRRMEEVFGLDITGVRYISVPNPRYSYKTGMLVCVPMRLKSQYSGMLRPDSVLMAYVNGDSLVEAYFGQIGDSRAGMMIYDGMQCMVSTDNYPELESSADFAELLDGAGSESRDIELDGGKYCVVKVFDDVTGLSFIISEPFSAVTESSDGARRIVDLTTLLTAIGIVILAAVTVYINYRPIKQAVNRLAAERRDGRSKDEITSIMDALDNAMMEKELMSSAMSKREAMAEDFVLQRLFAGKPVSEHDLETVGLSGSGRFFVVTLLANVTPALNGDIREQLLISLAEGYSCRVLTTQPSLEGQVIFLFAQDGSAGDISGQAAKEILDFVLENGADKCRVGVGNAESTLGNIRSSYLSSAIAADQGDDNSVSFYAQTVQNFSTFENYPSEKVLLLMQHIKQGSLQSALSALDEVFAHISGGISSWVMERFVCHDVVSMLVRTVSELGVHVSSEEMGRMMSFADISELKDMMAELARQACEKVQHRRDTTDREISESIIEYVNTNCLKQDIGLEMAADHFGMSIYAFSTLFKRTVGVGFREYIVKKRLERAKDLIMTTDMTVKSIASEVGFGDVSYFIRVFKNNYNETPTQMKSNRRVTR